MQTNGVISAIIVGLIIGILGRLIVPGRQHIGIFVTFVIGVGSALLGTVAADALNINDRAPVTYQGYKWDWIVLAFQIVFSVIGIALASAVSNTRVATKERAQVGSRR